MIISRIGGGLGNQLFQYAAGRALALHLGVEHKIDISPFFSNKKQVIHFDYALCHFKVPQNIAHNKELITGNPFSKIGRLKRALGLGFKGNIVREYDDLTAETLFSQPDNTYLIGVFAEHVFFNKYEAQIRDDFKVITPTNFQNATILEEIQSQNAVSLHIRRGDYVDSEKARATWGSLGLDYYKRGVEHIAAQQKHDITCYVFSNDPNWAKENIHLPFKTHIMAHNDALKHYEDFRLLSACKHHVIANSTFSWWGAFLCENADKIIVAPQTYYSKPSKMDERFYLPHWHRLTREV
jgi:Glycosyl transferase family 11